ncbi:aldo/keto reductase [Micromonospora zamorensis]|uniref:aldo/keto reductase n=1 Tax=Micromonospora zamorensis TaxID=709883 RepID=UPI00371DC70D
MSRMNTVHRTKDEKGSLMANLPPVTGIPMIGLGTFPFSGVFSQVDESSAADVLSAYFDGGGSYVETAPVYAPNDVDLGRLLSAYDRETFFLATKCVTSRGAGGATVRSGKSDHLRNQCHEELRRLRVDHLDLLQLHTVPEDASPEESFGTLHQLKTDGLTRNIGVSNVSLGQLRAFAAIAPVDYVQNRFSFIHRTHHREIETYCTENGILLNPYQVIERGLLTSTPPPAFREGDLRNRKFEYSGDVYHFIRSWVLNELQPIAEAARLSLTQLAIRWALAQPAIGVISVGATKKEQVTENLTAATDPLPPRAASDMEAAFVKLEKAVRDRVGLSVDEYRGL